MWTLATSTTLRGVNIYAHHPPYPGGPYAYFPLFLDIELPFQWLAEHTALSFTVLGKLPIVAADVAVAALLYRQLRSSAVAARWAALGAAAYFLNPLVLYNGAWYGRFDALALALLLPATARLAGRRELTAPAALAYAAAVAAKTFPIFLAPLLIRVSRRRGWLLVAATGGVLALLSLPYLGQPVPYLTDIVHDAGKFPQGMSWWVALRGRIGDAASGDVSNLGFILLAAGIAVIARRSKDDPVNLGVAATLVLFLLCNKVILEQYLIWPLPWLILSAAELRSHRAWACASLAGWLTLGGCLDNETFHPFGRNSSLVGVLLALGELAFLVVVLRRGRVAPQVPAEAESARAAG